jgi:hypothetical protein
MHHDSYELKWHSVGCHFDISRMSDTNYSYFLEFIL